MKSNIGYAKPTTVFFFSFLCFLALTAGIALVTPIYGGPDEVSHSIYAWAVVDGQVPMSSWDVSGPKYLSEAYPECWKFKVDVASSCQGLLNPSDTETVTLSTSAANYPPLYYALVGWPMLFLSGAEAFIAVRLVSALLFSLILAYGIAALYRSDLPNRAVLAIGASAFLVPSAFALGGVINPQALEISAAFALGCVLLPLVFSRGGASRRLIEAAVLVALVILSRPIGPYWPFLLCIVLLIAMGKDQLVWLFRRAQTWVFIGAAAISSGVWLYWRQVVSSVTESTTDPSADCKFGCAVVNTANQWLNWTKNTVSLAGWVDTEPSALYVTIYLFFMFGVLFLAAVVGLRRRRIAVWLGLAIIPGSAILIETLTVYPGMMWQARYALPFVIPFCAFAFAHIVQSSRLSERELRRLSFYGILAWAIVQVAFLGRAVYRFWVGIGDGPYSAILDLAPAYTLFGLGLAIVGVLAELLGVMWLLRKVSGLETVPLEDSISESISLSHA